MMLDKNRIGNIISTRRKEFGLTQRQLAEKLFITDKAVSKWETGKGYPDIQTLPLLAEVLDIELSEIMFDNTSKVSSIVDKEVRKEKVNTLIGFKKKKSTIIFMMIPLILLILFILAALLSVATALNSALVQTGWKRLLFDYFIGWILTSTFFSILPLAISFIKYRLTINVE